ncbi:MAG: methylmalonyl-CoA epimerase [Chloroflexota bacterium]|nr:methylmalonyl-CoA epimerase [Chloroflexota bacterium]
MIKRIDHIAIVVKDLDESVQLYEKILGMKPEKITTVQDQAVKSALYIIGDGSELELIQPIDSQSGVAKFLEKKGEGMHHVAFEVDNINQEIKSMLDKGVEVIDKQPRKGMAGTIAFLHPKSTGSVLMEMTQKD